MEISKLADKIIQNLNSAGVYSEFTDVKLKTILYTYLGEEYNKKLNDLSIRFDLRVVAGEKLDQSDYDEEFEKLKEELMRTISDISRTK